MTFARLRAVDWVAMIAALALLLLMASDWYTTAAGVQARRIQHNTQGNFPGEVGQDLRNFNQQARYLAQSQEKNAWQEDHSIDRLILVVLLGTVVLAIGAGFLRAAGRRFNPPLTPSGLAAIGAALGALLVAYRIVQKPGIDEAARIKAGAPLALLTLGIIAFAAARGLKHEEAGTAFRELPKPPEPPAKEEPAAP